MSLVFGKTYKRLGAHSAPGESCHVCSRSLALSMCVECLRKSCKPQLDVSRVVCLRPHTDQALLAFTVRFWCPEVGLLNLLSQALNKRSAPSLPCCAAGQARSLNCSARAAGPHRPGWFMLRPGCSGSSALAVSHWEGGTAGLCHHRSPGSTVHVLSHPRCGADLHTRADAGSYQREHAREDSHGSAVRWVHPRQHGCKWSRAGAGLLASQRQTCSCSHSSRLVHAPALTNTGDRVKPQRWSIFGSTPKNCEHASDVRVLDGGKLEQMAGGFRAAALLRTDIYRQI